MIWLALLVAPAIALADQLVAYSAVGYACMHDLIFLVHAIHALSLVLAAACVVPASRVFARSIRQRGGMEARRPFLAGVGVAAGALSVLVIAAMWLPTWVIGPCVA